MFSIQSGVELIIAAAGGIYIIGQIKATAEANRKGLEMLKKDLTDLIETNNKSTQDLLTAFKTHQRENLEREISHLKDIITINHQSQKEDIQELRREQEASNRLKSRVCMLEASVKSLHKRMDVEPTLPIGEDIE